MRSRAACRPVDGCVGDDRRLLDEPCVASTQDCLSSVDHTAGEHIRQVVACLWTSSGAATNSAATSKISAPNAAAAATRRCLTRRRANRSTVAVMAATSRIWVDTAGSTAPCPARMGCRPPDPGPCPTNTMNESVTGSPTVTRSRVTAPFHIHVVGVTTSVGLPKGTANDHSAGSARE
jgi:hypothetical protein